MAMSCTTECVRTDVASMPLRLYRNSVGSRAAPLVLHLHGGAFTHGSLEAGRTIATLLAEAGATVVSAEYPLAPQHPFPQALQSTFSVLKWMHANRAQWVSRKSGLYVAGEEAGGNIAAGLALMARDQVNPPLAGQILLSPMLDPCLATCSVRAAALGPVGCQWADGWHDYLHTADKAAHPYAAPSNATRLAGLAPALVLTAKGDPMHDESLCYAERLRAAGVPVQDHVVTSAVDWLAALSRPFEPEEAWATEVRSCFADFFALRLSAQRPAVRLHSVQP